MSLIFKTIVLLIVISNIVSQGDTTDTTDLVECGVSRPAVDSDCLAYTTESNACCFYSYFTKTGCYWLGTRYKGKTNYGGLYVNCDQRYVRIYYLLPILLLILLI
jgi:hypothetical protein